MADISYEIVKHIGKLGEASSRGWQKEVNLISWNGSRPKIDIRDWSENHDKMGKGITLTREEALQLLELLQKEGDCRCP